MPADLKLRCEDFNGYLSGFGSISKKWILEATEILTCSECGKKIPDGSLIWFLRDQKKAICFNCADFGNIIKILTAKYQNFGIAIPCEVKYTNS